MKEVKDEKKKLSKKEMKELRKKNFSNLKKSLKFIFTAKYALLLLLLFEILETVLGFVSPIVESNFITNLTEMNFDKLKIFFALMIIIVISEQACYYINHLIWNKYVRNKVTFQIRKFMMSNIARIKNKSFDENSTGTFISRMGNDSSLIVQNFSTIISMSVYIIGNLGCIAYVYYLNIWIGIIFTIGIIINVLFNKFFEDEKAELRKINKDEDEKTRSLVTEFLRGIRDIKTLNITKKFSSKVNDQIAKRDDLNTKVTLYRDNIHRITRVIEELTAYLSIFIGLKFVMDGDLTSANLITIFLYRYKLSDLVYNINYIVQLKNDLFLSLDRVFSFEDDEKYPKEKFGDLEITNIQGQIEFDNVDFSYNEKAHILKGLSFVVKSNTTIALVGESGSGKTTALNLLTKSYDLDEGHGKITIDGVNINAFNEESFRNSISIITQNPYIFNMTIRENLLLVKEDATEEELINVCKKAQLYDYVVSLPDGLDSLIGEGGLNLSGGQRQRLAIARSLLKNCKIMLFDEATSALDNITQKEVQNSIDALKNEYTIIIVAHRLSTIKNVDEILILKDGKVAARGTHQNLLSNAIYSKLYQVEI